MNIAEAERRTGLSRANIRFYEKEGLLTPTRGENGYRDYTEDNYRHCGRSCCCGGCA